MSIDEELKALEEKITAHLKDSEARDEADRAERRINQLLRLKQVEVWERESDYRTAAIAEFKHVQRYRDNLERIYAEGFEKIAAALRERGP